MDKKDKKMMKKIEIVIILLFSIATIIYSATPSNYICQQNPNHPSCTNNNNNQGGGGGNSGGSGGCSDSDIQKFLKGEDPFPHPPTGSCPAQIRSYKVRIGKCENAKKCLQNQVETLKKEIEELEKKIAEIEKDPKFKELAELQKTEGELKSCIAQCKSQETLCEEYVKQHVADVLNCPSGAQPPAEAFWNSTVCKQVCKICPQGKYNWCPKKCTKNSDCGGVDDMSKIIGIFKQHLPTCVDGLCKKGNVDSWPGAPYGGGIYGY